MKALRSVDLNASVLAITVVSGGQSLVLKPEAHILYQNCTVKDKRGCAHLFWYYDAGGFVEPLRYFRDVWGIRPPASFNSIEYRFNVNGMISPVYKHDWTRKDPCILEHAACVTAIGSLRLFPLDEVWPELSHDYSGYLPQFV